MLILHYHVEACGSINVEACGSIKAVKYLFKYIYKGHDRASMAMREADKEDSEGNIDEIK